MNTFRAFLRTIKRCQQSILLIDKGEYSAIKIVIAIDSFKGSLTSLQAGKAAGEGRLDSQTVMGKAPSGVAAIAKKYNLPVIAFSGCVTEEAEVCNDFGIDAFFPILRTVCSLEDAMNVENAYRNMTDISQQVARLIKTVRI